VRALCAAFLLAARTFGPQALPEVQDAEDPLVDAAPLVTRDLRDFTRIPGLEIESY